MTKIAATIAVLSLAVGCATHGGIQTAHTVGKGRFQGAIEPGVTLVAGGSGTRFSPNLNAAGRFGVTDRLDLGGRIGTTLYEINGKIAMTDPDPEGFVASIAPAVTALGFGGVGAGAGFVNVQVPALFGLPLGHHQLVIGPKARTLTVFGGSDGARTNATGLMAGGVLALSARVGEAVRLHPEVAVDVPVFAAGSASIDGEAETRAQAGLQGVLVGINFGILIGGR